VKGCGHRKIGGDAESVGRSHPFENARNTPASGLLRMRIRSCVQDLPASGFQTFKPIENGGVGQGEPQRAVGVLLAEP